MPNVWPTSATSTTAYSAEREPQQRVVARRSGSRAPFGFADSLTIALTHAGTLGSLESAFTAASLGAMRCLHRARRRDERLDDAARR